MALSDDELQDTINAFHGNGCNQVQAALALGIARTTLQSRLKEIEKRGIKPQPINALPIGHNLSGVSRYYKGDGSPGGFWVKANKNLEAQKAALVAAAKALSEEIKKEKPTPFTKLAQDDLLSCYIITDYHFGQLSWGEETGADWDLQIAEELLVKWFAAAIKAAPDSKVGLLAQMGDFMHTDGLNAITPTSGNLLDADTRFQKMVEVCVRVLRRVIAMLLEKHESVHVILAEGNHDIASSVWLREMFSVLYENEPRVKIDGTHLPYYAVEWGRTALFIHHGHKKKLEDVSRVFAGLYREIFGRTKYAYAHVGHLHHIASKEDQLMVVRQHPTLAAMDAHSARAGYNSMRAASVITYSKQFGEVSEISIKPEMVK